MKAGPVKLKQLMKVIYNSLIPFKGFIAINLFGIVFARKEYKELSRRTLNHEAIHTAQMKEMLYVFFYLWYVIEWIIKLFRYGHNAYQSDRCYLKVRKHYAWLKVLV